MPTIQEIQPTSSTPPFTGLHYIGGHVEIKTIFRDPSNQAPVQVYYPEAIFENGDGKFKPNEILKPFQPTKLKTGEYVITFITDATQFTEGQYKITLQGYQKVETNGTPIEKNKIAYTSTFEVTPVSGKQTLIDMLRFCIFDDFPELNVIESKTDYRLTDGQLYQCLTLALSEWNSTPPPSLTPSDTGNYSDITLFPYIDVLIKGAEIAALNRDEIKEIYNKLIYNDDIQFQINRTGDLHQKLAWLSQIYYSRLEKQKKAFIIYSTYQNVKIITSTKLPFRVLRALSFNVNWSMSLGDLGSFGF